MIGSVRRSDVYYERGWLERKNETKEGTIIELPENSDFYQEKHCDLLIRDMTTKDDLRGKILIVDASRFKEEQRTQSNQFCMVTGGSGCTLGYNDSSLLVTFMDKEIETRITVDSCIGVVKEEVLPDWVKEKRDRLSPETIENERIFASGTELPHEMYGEHRKLAEFDNRYLLVSRVQTNPNFFELPESDMESKQERPSIVFQLAYYNQQKEELESIAVFTDFDEAKHEFAVYANLVKATEKLRPSEENMLYKLCKQHFEQDMYDGLDEEMMLAGLMSYFDDGKQKEEQLDFEEEEDEYDR